MVDILMATYNGEKYISTQISSIINQNFKDWILYIHDDGSTDSTVEIIKKFVASDSRIKFIDDGVLYKNPGKNFLHLLQFSKSDLICFADQDDYWFEYKLEKMVNHFKSNETFPKLILSECFLWNVNNFSIVPKQTVFYAKKLEEFIFLNGGLQGCAMMCNSKLKDLALKYDLKKYTYMHDHLFSLLAFSFGKVEYISEKLFLYRQHEKNTSIHLERTFFEYLKKILSNNKVPLVYKNAYNGIKSFYESYKNELSLENQKIIETYLNLKFQNCFMRFFKILFSKFSLGKNGHLKLVFKSLIRPYWRNFYE